jgi:hypothetical protein
MKSSYKNVLLWVAAVFIMVAAVIYQRMTGPTYPYRGNFELNGETYKHKLLRSQETTEGARIAIPSPNDSAFVAQLHYKRFKTKDSLTVAVMTNDNGELMARLPKQPAAGKMEYYITLQRGDWQTRIPAAAEENIVLRYKDPVPGYILWPHVIFMFFAVLIGMRAGLSAIFEPGNMRKWAFISLVGMTIGGMILGPIVQKFAFGEYWTGFPLGSDLTDNKMLIMWLSWIIAGGIIGTRPKPREGMSRIAVAIAAIVMTAVYLIPHSMQGSELDYDKLDKGVDPKEAIGTGD